MPRVTARYKRVQSVIATACVIQLGKTLTDLLMPRVTVRDRRVQSVIATACVIQLGKTPTDLSMPRVTTRYERVQSDIATACVIQLGKTSTDLARDGNMRSKGFMNQSYQLTFDTTTNVVYIDISKLRDK